MYKYITLVLLIVVLFVTLKKNNEKFSDNYTDNSVYSPSFEKIKDEGYFKYLNKEISILDLSQDKYNNLRRVPILFFESFKNCPNLYYLFNDLRKFENGKLERGEGTEGINFRNECEKIFYNSSSFIRIEHPIIEIEAIEVVSKKQNMIFKAGKNDDLNLEYNLKKLESQESLSPSYPPSYICNNEKEIKQINFQVKSDFTLEDIYKFVDYCFTQLCFGMIYIEYMKLVSNHYRVLPCPRKKGGFFILPERIRHQVSKEGKYYTRAKCNCCSLNLIVLFGDHLPEKFDYIYPNAPSTCLPVFNGEIDTLLNQDN